MTSTLPPVLHATLAEMRGDRHPRANEDVHFTRAVAAAVIEAFSEPGDTVLDPFAGFGTTLAVAEERGRHAVGVELLEERVELVEDLLTEGRVIEGDARMIADLLPELGDVALCLTSPPYMTANDHPTNPLTAYETFDGDYDTYLRELSTIGGRIHDLLRPGGHLVVNVADIDYRGFRTPLVADAATALTDPLELVQTTRIEWDRMPHDLVHDSLLVLRRPAETAR